MAEEPDGAHAGGATDAERERLRKAGEAYLEQLLAEPGGGGSRGLKRDPFAADPTPGPAAPVAAPRPAAARARGRKRQQAVDPDLVEMGNALGRVKSLLVLVTFALCTASTLVWSKRALDIMPLPATLLGFHMVSTACLVLALSATGLQSIDKITVTGLRVAAPGALLDAGLGLACFFALRAASMEVFLATTTAGAPLLLRAVDRITAPVPPPPLDAASQAAGVVAAVAALLCLVSEARGGRDSYIALIMWFVLLVAARLWETALEAVRLEGSLALLADEPLPGSDAGNASAMNEGKLASLVQRARRVALRVAVAVAGDEMELPPRASAMSRALYANTLPFLVTIPIGMVSGEPRFFVDHELSVPTVTVLMVSAVAGAGATVAALGAQDLLSVPAFAGTAAMCQLGTVALSSLVRSPPEPPFEVCAAIVCVLAGATVKVLPHVRLAELVTPAA